jgi:arylsulfatase A-like enzyme
MIVLTSDHGDYLGDHWLGEKELFYEASVRVPMLVYDPDPAAAARAARLMSGLWKRLTAADVSRRPGR